METTRRDLIAFGAALAPFLAFGDALAASASKAALKGEEGHAALMAIPGMKMHGNETVSILLYPHFTALDVVGPHYFLACMMGAKVELVTTGTTLAAVASDLGLAIAPTHTLKTSALAPTVLLVPGGTNGTVDAMERQDVVMWLKDRGGRAAHVTSVCTGALLLGRAGLLRGKRATAHWIVRDELTRFGATPVDARVVTDGRIITAAGVTAGLDFALALVAALRGQPYARALALQAEYAPEPPISGGTPATAGKDMVEAYRDMFAPLTERVQRFSPM